MNNPLSLSVRIAEGFLSKEEAILSLEDVAQLSKQAGYDALCMRASQIGVQSPRSEVTAASQWLRSEDIPVTMVTGDFDIVYNNENGPGCLHRITPYLDLAQHLDCQLIRVAIKTHDDITPVQKAADEALERGISLVHQCHTLSLFETVESCVETAQRIDRKNFGIIYEPANLEICGQPYVGEVFDRLLPWLKNVYLQNQILKEDGAVTLNTWCRGPIGFDLIPVHAPGGIDFPAVFEELQRVGYQGPITVHQSAQPGASPLQTAMQSAQYLRTLMS